MYRNRSIEMTYSKVLGFSQLEKVPVSRSCAWEKAKTSLAESLLSEFVWSFRTEHLSKVRPYLSEVGKLCGQ